MKRLKFNKVTEPLEDVKKWRKWVRSLKKAFPADCRVEVHLVPYKELIVDGHRLHSYLHPMPKSWQLLVEYSEMLSHAWYSLIHEWAHVLQPPGQRKTHHNAFRDTLHKITYHFIPDR